jgi:hypothetical protein
MLCQTTGAYARVAPHSPCWERGRWAEPVRPRFPAGHDSARQVTAYEFHAAPSCLCVSGPGRHRFSTDHAPRPLFHGRGLASPVLSASLSNCRPSLSSGQQPGHYPTLGTCGSHAEPGNPNISARSARLQGRSPGQVRAHCSNRTCDPAQNPRASLVTCGRCRRVTARPARNTAGSNLIIAAMAAVQGCPSAGITCSLRGE